MFNRSAVVAAVLLVDVVGLCCHSGRTVRSDVSGVDFSSLLHFRTTAQIQPSTAPPFTLHRISDTDPSSDEYHLEVVWLEFSAGKAKMTVRQVSATGGADEVYEQLANTADLAICNGGYWGTRETTTKDGKKDTERYPLGLVRANGREVAPVSPEMSGGIAFQRGSKFSVLPTSLFASLSEDPSDAIQCKPMLVEDGHSGMRGDDHRRDDRLAIGVDASGGIIVALATQPQGALTLVEFARFLLISKEDGGPGCVNALNLDGGPGTHVYIPSLNLHLGRHGDSYVNNVVHIRR